VARAQWLSLAAGLACVALALRPARRRVALAATANGNGDGRHTAGAHGRGNGAHGDGGDRDDRDDRDGDGSHDGGAELRPLTLARALRYRGERPAPWVVAVVAAAVGGLGWFLAGLPIGVVVGVAAAAGSRYPDTRRWVLAGAPTALALAAGYVCVVQLLRNPEPGLDWPGQMRAVHPLGWLAALLPLVDVVVSATRRCARTGCATLGTNRTSRPDTHSPDDGDEGADSGSQQAVLVEST
jgi:hypothetical protein